jgi:hypothetical protein
MLETKTTEYNRFILNYFSNIVNTGSPFNSEIVCFIVAPGNTWLGGKYRAMNYQEDKEACRQNIRTNPSTW